MIQSIKPDSDIAVTATTKSLRGKLMFAASAGILALVAPSGFYGMRAQAQSLPAGCADDQNFDTDNDGDNFADDNETIECEGVGVGIVTETTPFVYGVTTSADNLTIVALDDVKISPQTNQGNALEMNGDGAQTLDVRATAKIHS